MLHSLRRKNGQGKVSNFCLRNLAKQIDIFDTVPEKSDKNAKICKE
jgi:hypothetical protein